MADSDKDILISGNINSWVDQIIHKLKLESTDPLPIHFKSSGIKVQDGNLRGLSSIRRWGDCTFVADNENIKISLQLQFIKLYAEFQYETYIGFIPIKGSVKAVARKVAVNPSISLQDGKIHLEVLKLSNLEESEILCLTGTTPLLNWLIKLILNKIMFLLRYKIIQTLENEGQKNIQLILNNISLSKL